MISGEDSLITYAKIEMSHPRKTNGKDENKNYKAKKIEVTRGPNNDIGRAFDLGR